MSDMIEQFKHRIAGMIGRCILSAIDDGRKIQSVQAEALEGEIYDNVERFQNYGFTSHPHAGCEGLMIYVGGLRSHGICIAADDRRYRKTDLQAGEVALYDDLGQAVYLTRDGILIYSDLKVTIAAPSVDVTADDVTINSDNINLGGAGGAAVARVGDTVSGGVITSGSSKVSAA